MKIRFDDYVKRYDDNNCWSQICDKCAKKYKVNERYLDVDGGGGICGVKGCENEADHYIDFPDDKITEEEVDGHDELMFEFDVVMNGGRRR